MNYLLIYSDEYEFYVTEFNNKTLASAYIYESYERTKDVSKYRLYEVANTFNIDSLMLSFEVEIKEKRREALAKLSDQDKIVLGIK